MSLLPLTPRAAMLLSAGLTLAAAAAWRGLAAPWHGRLACLDAQKSSLRHDVEQCERGAHPDEEFLARDLVRLQAQRERLERFRTPMGEDELLASLQYLAQRHDVVIDRADFQPQPHESSPVEKERGAPHAAGSSLSPTGRAGAGLTMFPVSTVTLALRGPAPGMDKFLRALQVASRCRVDALQPTTTEPADDGFIAAHAVVSHWRMVGESGDVNSRPPTPSASSAR